MEIGRKGDELVKSSEPQSLTPRKSVWDVWKMCRLSKRRVSPTAILLKLLRIMQTTANDNFNNDENILTSHFFDHFDWIEKLLCEQIYLYWKIEKIRRK